MVYVRHFEKYSALFNSEGVKIFEDRNRSCIFFYAAERDLIIATIH